MKCGEVITTINPFHRRNGVWYAAHFLTVFDGEHKRLT